MSDMKRNHFFCLLFLIGISIRLNAQSDSIAQKAVFKLGVFYNSALNYYGRTDSLRSSGVFPLGEIWFDKHLYINAAPVFINNSAASFEYAGTVATAGYMFRDQKWAGNIYVVKPFYKSGSQLVQSALKLQGSAAFSWLNKYLNISAGGDIKYSDKVDYGLNAGLDHLFRFEPGDNKVLVIDPSFYVNAGTQQFTQTAYKKSGFLLFPGAQQLVTEETKKFNILSYEFSMPTVLAIGKLQLILNPAYVIPQNLVVVPQRPDLSERGKEMFYITMGAKFSF
jgi:hypothetical protein